MNLFLSKPLQPPFRRAAPGDARAIAELTNRAGDGIPGLLWEGSAGPGESAIDIGARRAARTGVNFSFENAIVGDDGGEVTCLLLGYAITDTDPGDLSGLPDLLHPLVRLECRAAGSWYVNVVAVAPGHERRGLATALMAIAEDAAAEAGCRRTSLIVASDNEPALRLYEKIGYAVEASEPVIPHPRLHVAGDWLLMIRPVIRPPSSPAGR